ncbi:glutamate racemase [Phosphitispora fastidiosa]|uniref:glutamate racemase n=1 Tax=Phosphitispora fastidiosa TaxID=2837202 RepID=UPI001E61C004|nr:glutamate racemase [Phosphitispora fastidiosa]MBU7005428.1 glutamate racemase [Phosphitispora fastidiosa]
MNNNLNNLPIGVFDSGIGGISLLAEMVRTMPGEHFLYLSDSANVPYGTKNRECIREVSLAAARLLFAKGIKALVVACNTATSAAITYIREQYEMPVIGMEPAIKPAVEKNGKGKIIVLATPLTLKENKFNDLFRRFNCSAEIIPIPCPGFAELIESEAQPEVIREYLIHIIGDGSRVNFNEVSTVVLGCTHYCFVRDEISRVVGPQAVIIDGTEGTARHVMRTLEAGGLVAAENSPKRGVEFLTTGDPDCVIPLCERFFDKALGMLNK